MRRALLVLLVGSAFILAAGCGGGGGNDAYQRKFTAVDVTLPDVAPAPLTTTVLADGRVTEDEMRSALDAAAACVRDAGFDASVTAFTPGVGGEVTASKHSDAAREAVATCTAQFIAPVQPTYAKQNGPSEEETRQQNELAAECLRAKGYTIAVGATRTEMLMTVGPTEFGKCDGGQP